MEIQFEQPGHMSFLLCIHTTIGNCEKTKWKNFIKKDKTSRLEPLKMSFFSTFSNINISTPASWHCCNSPAGWKRWKVSERFRKVEILTDSEKGYKGYNITCFLFLDWWVCQKPMIGHLPPYALYKPILSRYMVVQILGYSSNITHIFHLKWVFNFFPPIFRLFLVFFAKTGATQLKPAALCCFGQLMPTTGASPLAEAIRIWIERWLTTCHTVDIWYQ